MKLQRLFHVLVVMSAASGCTGDDGAADAAALATTDAAPTTADAATAVIDAAAAPHDGAHADGAPCLCNTDSCCDRTMEPAQIVAGFECCWSTTCP